MRKLWALFAALILVVACSSTVPRSTRTSGGEESRTELRPTPGSTPGPIIPTPAPTPPPIGPAPAPPPPGVVPTNDLQAPLIRILLRRSSSPVELPEPGRAWRASSKGRTEWLWGPLVIRAERGESWWQVGAFGDETSVTRTAADLKRNLGASAPLRFVAGEDGLTRVCVGWSKHELADPVAALGAAGFPDAFEVLGSGSVRVDGATGEIVSDEEILLEAVGDFPVTVGSKRYRGRLRTRASEAEVLVINELNMERYLQGVVPGEMGPAVFPELEALKAQSVAARTYAVAHLGDHDDEGYDICATPACQVYHGVGVEHSLSTRAIEETSGLVALFDGTPIDAMYTSTCGGHTEDSSELFSGRSQPYLQGVPCAWERSLSLAGGPADGGWINRDGFSAQVTRRVLALGDDSTPEEIVAAVAAISGGQAGDVSRGDLESFSIALIRAAHLETAADVLTSQSQSAAVDRLLFLADLYDVALDPPTSGGLRGSWPAAAALAVLEIGGIVQRDAGEAVPYPSGVGIFPRRASASELLPAHCPLWERWREGFRPVSSIDVLPGTHLERWKFGSDVVALVVRRSGGNGEADRRSAWREWVREKSWPELAQRLGVPDLQEIKILRRADSGRVVELAAIGVGGTRREWKGFDVRRALDLPETLFSLDLVNRPDGTRVARFLGRGWGHGVGLCQNGAYGLARSGKTFDAILRHYYRGIVLAPWYPTSAPLPVP